MNDTIVDKETYQKNRRMMCWIALALMTASTIATIAFPSRMAEADSIIMAQYLSLSGLVSAYFLLGNKSETKKQPLMASLFFTTHKLWPSILFDAQE